MSLEEFRLVEPHIPKRGKLLEVGCYPFNITKELRKKGYMLYGIDINYNRRDLNVFKCDIELEALPFPDNYFDNVLMMQVMEHLGRRPMGALKELRRVTKPGGKLILSTPNFFCLKNISKLLFTGVQHELVNLIKHNDYTGHIRTYTMKELEILLKHCGWNVKYGRYLFYKKDTWTVGGVVTRLIPMFRDHILIVSEVAK